MTRLSLFSELQDVRFDLGLIDEKAGHIEPSGLKFPMFRLSIGKYDDRCHLRHGYEMGIVIRPDWILHFKQSPLVRAAIGKRIADPEAPVSPRHRVPIALCDCAVIR